MTTYLLLALHDDGRSEAYQLPQQFGVAELAPVDFGNDRGEYRTFEVEGFSIDVMSQPKGTKS